MKADTRQEDYRYFEDFEVGEVIPLRHYTVSEDEILEFATRYDPQTQHIDPAAALDTPMKGLLASGWHTCAIFMRMQCDSFLTNSSSIVSPGTDKIRWLKPVRPGDVLCGTNEIVEARVSRSQPDRGIIVSHVEVRNQREELVMTLKTVGFFGTRPR